MPVKLTVPTMMPATAVAIAMPIMLRPPSSRLSYKSLKPCLTVPANERWRKYAIIGRWVTSINAMKVHA